MSHVSNQRVTDEAIAISITINNNNEFNDKNILSLTIYDYKLIHNFNKYKELNNPPIDCISKTSTPRT